MTREQAQELLTKYQLGKCTPDEKILLDRWYFNEAAKQAVPDAPQHLLKEEQLIWNRILEEVPLDKKVRHLKKWHSIAAAAAVLFFLSFGIYFSSKKTVITNKVAKNQPLKNDIAPGGNKAILTLANGSQIVLTGAKNGTIAQQGLVAVNKTADGQIVYKNGQGSSGLGQTANKVTMNTMTTPRGGQYWVVLPDGSRVLLNSSSSLTYPTSFSGNERKVELTGEAYFEVAHNPSKPFRVNSNGQTVEVLGTHFNINAYNDEAAIKTTLLEGKVKVTDNAKHKVHFLQPGQQAVFNAQTFEVNPVETDGVIAWKNGQFVFDGDNIQYIMRMVSRWYDVDVTYNGPVPDDIFGGSVSRFGNVSEVLKTLQLTGKVHFKIEGQKIIVSK
jgi:ferric-dicitrate binding protein FerR (iron transport regulator)